MPPSRLQCPECDAVLKTAGLPAGKSIKCPECRAVLRVPADDPDEEDSDRDETDAADDGPRRKKSKKGRDDRNRKKAGGSPLGLWIGVGLAAVAAVVVVLVVVLGGKKGAEKGTDKPGDPAPAAREGGGSDAYAVERRIETNIPLPNRDPFILVRGILSLGASADGSVIGVSSAASRRKYTISRATGRVMAEFDDPDDKPDNHEAYNGRAPILSPDGKLVIFGHIEPRVKSVKVRDSATGNVVKDLRDDKIDHFNTVAFSPKGDTLYATVHFAGKHVLAGWRTSDWQQVCHVETEGQREPTAMFPLADGKTVATIAQSRGPEPQLDFYDVRQQKYVRTVTLPYKAIDALALAPDGKTVVVLGDHGDGKSVDVYDLEHTKQLSALDVGRIGAIFDAAFHFLPSGKLAVMFNRSVGLFDPKTGKQTAVWKHDDTLGGRKITGACFCTNGEILMVLDGDTATILVVRLKE